METKQRKPRAAKVPAEQPDAVTEFITSQGFDPTEVQPVVTDNQVSLFDLNGVFLTRGEL